MEGRVFKPKPFIVEGGGGGMDISWNNATYLFFSENSLMARAK